MKVLIADDDAVSCKLLARTLRVEGYEIALASDGEEAWRVLQADEPPRLLLLDWVMPGIEGPELCRRVRRLRGPFYVILLTARGTHDEIAEGLEAGADDHVTKPFHPRELRARLRVGRRILDLQAELTRTIGEMEQAMTCLAERTEALQASEARSRAVVDTSFHGIVLVDRGGAICDFNPAAERMFGWPRSEALGRFFDEVVLPARLHGLETRHPVSLLRTRADASGRVEVAAARRGGEEFPADLAVSGIEGGLLFVAFIRDLSEARQLELELRHAQKLESVGRLAAGIAHEINTPIQFIGDNVHFLSDAFAGVGRVLEAHERVEAGARAGAVDPSLLEEVAAARQREDVDYFREEVPKALAQTLEGVGRVATIVRAMKEFAHGDAAEERMPADLNRGIESTIGVACHEIKYVAEVETELGELPPVVCNLGDLNQVFLNLLVNAAHAIAEVVGNTGEKGHIRVRTSCNGEMAVIEISDTGAGIPEEVRSRIFDPFFTTKEVGRGTGQGLAIARNIVVEKHGGRLTFESAVGKGTTFYVHLPVEGVPRAVEPAAA